MLINSSQIESNLRRTASKGYISILNQGQLEFLALKHFGIKDEDGNIIGYQCPYSGEVYTNYKNIVLEHIIPIDSKGGTVLFNCIPTSSEVNKTNEKGAKHLITWWTNSKYWDTNATLRLEKLVNYMLEAYERVFEEHTLEELETSYLDFDLSEELTINNDLELSEQQESLILKKQGEQNGIHSYLGFILSCIETLEKYNVNTIEIRSKLKDLENKHIFENINRFQLFQNILQQVIIKRLGDDNRSYLTYLLKFDIKLLMDSIEYQNQDEIYNEIDLRLKNIENLLREKNLSIKDYFKNVDDITDIDMIYKNINSITEEDKIIFLENISLGYDSKINIFIEMLNKGNKNILSFNNKETFEGYENVRIGGFWNAYKSKIISIIFEELKDNSEYDTARKIVNKFIFENNTDLKIEVFIKMLNKGNKKILKHFNQEVFDGYESIPIGGFWNKHKNKIIQKLFVELKDKEEYNIARHIIREIQFENDINQKIYSFINMLNKGNSNILNQKNNEVYEDFDNIKVGLFWQVNKTKILEKLFEELKDNHEYDIARKIINQWLFDNDLEKKINIFIDMLNKGNSKILIGENQEKFEGYEDIPIGAFWNRNRDKIIKILFEELKDNSEYDTARKIVNKFIFENNTDLKIEVFIKMLNKGNKEILKVSNKEVFEGYEDIQIGSLWHVHKNKIIKILFEELKDNPEYDIAKGIVNQWLFENNLDYRIKVFINMLNKGNTEILNTSNKEVFEGYENIPIGTFWSVHKNKIIKILFEELKDNSNYSTARQTVLKYYKVSSYEELKKLFELDIDKKIEIFIEMLNKGNSDILKQQTEATLEGYPSISLTQFWRRANNKTKIIQKLFEELKNKHDYSTARQTVLKYYKVSSYEELKKLFELDIDKKIEIFIEMLNKGNSNILIRGNTETLEGYPSIKLTQFWSTKENKSKIIQKLFEELKDNPDYNIARQTVLTYLKVSSYEEYLEKERKSQELKELKKIKKQLESVDKTLTRKENVASRKRV